MRLDNIFNSLIKSKNNFFRKIKIYDILISEWNYRKDFYVDATTISQNINNIQLDLYLTPNDIDFSETNLKDFLIIDPITNESLDYWIEYSDQNYVHLIILFPNIPANTKKLFYLYYGNSNAPLVSTGNIFDKFEDFESSTPKINYVITSGSFIRTTTLYKSGQYSGKATLGESLRNGIWFDIGTRDTDFIIEYSIAVGTTGIPQTVFGLSSSTSSGWDISSLYFYDNNLVLINDSYSVMVPSYKANYFYDITEIHHPESHTFDVRIYTYGNLVFSKDNIAYYADNTPRYFRLLDPSSTDQIFYTYVDNIRTRNYVPGMENIKITFT